MSFKYLPLGDICNVRRGTTITKQQTTSGIVPVVGGGTKPTYFHSMPNRESGCITVSGSGASAGFVNYWSEPIFASDCSTVEPSNDNQDRRFIYFFLLANQDYIYSNFRSGAAQPHVYAKDIATLEYPILDLFHQQKIVERLDAIFAEIDRATAAAETNIKNAEALIASYLNFIYNDKFKKSTKYRLGDVCEFQGGAQPAKSHFQYESSDENIRFIQIRDYKSDKNLVYIPKKLARRFCKVEDVMIGRYGPPVFQILRGIEGSYNVALMKAVPNEDILTKDFLFYFLKNPQIQSYVIRLSSRAAGQSGMNKETIEPYEIFIPSLLEQKKAVENILQLISHSQIIKNGLTAELKNLNDLKKSFLKMAFNNELVKGL